MQPPTPMTVTRVQPTILTFNQAAQPNGGRSEKNVATDFGGLRHHRPRSISISEQNELKATKIKGVSLVCFYGYHAHDTGRDTRRRIGEVNGWALRRG